MLKLNNKPILNALDLQTHFAPWEVLRQLDEVVSFARVHCQRLATVLKDEKGPFSGSAKPNALGYYGASCINKTFWLAIAEAGRKASDWKYADAGVKACMDDILKEHFYKNSPTEAQEKLLLQEYSDAKVDEKLQHIISSGQFTDSAGDVRTVVLLLALCELAEADVLKQSFRRWEAEPAAPGRRPAEDHSASPGPCQHAGAGIELLPDAPVLRLETRGAPYLFHYYEQDVLETGAVIQVVRLEACMGPDKFKKLQIHLIHSGTGEPAFSVSLAVGEYRDCLAVNGRIVKFLPTMAVSRNLFVARRPDTNRFEVVPFGAHSWTIDMAPGDVRAITCVAAGDEREQGFLFVSGGKVITNFYKPCEDYSVRMEMQMIFDTIVEAQIEPEGYCLLTNTGRVISDIPARNGRERVVSLSPFGRRETVHIKNKENIREIVMDKGQKSLAVRDRSGRIDVIFADDPDRTFQKRSDGWIQI